MAIIPRRSGRRVSVTLVDQFGNPVPSASVSVGYNEANRVRRVDLSATNSAGVASAALAQSRFEVFRKGYRRGDFVVALKNKPLKVTKTRTTSNSAKQVVATVTVHVPEVELSVRSVIRDQNNKPVSGAIATLAYIDIRTNRTLAMPRSDAQGAASAKLVSSRFDALRKSFSAATIKKGNTRLQVVGTTHDDNGRQMTFNHTVTIAEPKREIRAMIVDQFGKPVPSASVSVGYNEANRVRRVDFLATNSAGVASAALAQSRFEVFRKGYRRGDFVVALKNKPLKVTKTRTTSNSAKQVVATVTVHVPEVELSVRSVIRDQNNKPVSGAIATLPYRDGNKTRTRVFGATDANGSASVNLPQSLFEVLRKGYKPPPSIKKGSSKLELVKSTIKTNNVRQLVFEHTIRIEEPKRNVNITIVDQFGKPVRGAVVSVGYDEGNKVKRLPMPATATNGVATSALPQSRFELFRKGYRRGDFVVALKNKPLKITKTRTTANSGKQLSATVTVHVPEVELSVRSVIRDQNNKPVSGAIATLAYIDIRTNRTLAMPRSDAQGAASAKLVSSRFDALRKSFSAATIKKGNTRLQVVRTTHDDNGRQMTFNHTVSIAEPKREIRTVIVDQFGKPVPSAVLSSDYVLGDRTTTMTLPETDADGVASAKFEVRDHQAIGRNYKHPPRIEVGSETVEVISSDLIAETTSLSIIKATIRFAEQPVPEPVLRRIAVLVTDQDEKPIANAIPALKHFTSGNVETVVFGTTDLSGKTQLELPDDEFRLLQKNYMEPPSVARGGEELEIIRSRRTVNANEMMGVAINVRIDSHDDVPTDNQDKVPPEPDHDDNPPDPNSDTTDEAMKSNSAKRLFRFNAVRPISHKPDNKRGIEYSGELTPFLSVLQSKSTKAQARSVAADEEAKHTYFDADRLENTTYWPFIAAIKHAYLLRGRKGLEIDDIQGELIEVFTKNAKKAELDKVADNIGEIWDQYVICTLLPSISSNKHAGLVDTIKAIDLFKRLEDLHSVEEFIHALTKMPVLPSWLVKLVGGDFRDAYPFVLGISDLMVVKEDWIGYQRTEIAHIENVMATETRTTIRRSLDRTETTTTYETERIEEAMKETSTSIHSAMSKEIESTISQSSALSAGASVSASYGPAVSVDTNASFDFTTSSEETTNSAQEYAQDLVERAVTTVSNRERNETVTVVLTENENTHDQTFTNTAAGAEHVIGVYRHIDQIWKAQVFNYGKRLMLDFVVPEPSATWHLSQEDGAIPDQQLIEPPKLDLDPSTIAVINYQDYANEWGATNVPAPPDSIISVSKAIELEIPKFGTGEATSVSMALAQLQIPEGYRGTKAHVNFFADSKKENNDGKDDAKVLINGTEKDIESGTSQVSLNNHIGTLEFGVYIDFFEGGVASVRVDCEVSPETWANWQNSVYDALKAANDKAIDAYNAAKKNKAALKAVQQETLHPDIKSSIQKNELKRSVIAIMNRDNFEQSGAMDTTDVDGVDFADIRFVEAKDEGAHARFFEEAFEWREMTYLFYPYFWGRRKQWYKLMNERDPDINFNAFLQSGAARVNLAVRPGFEAAVMWFFATGEIWHGGPTPMIGDPLYVALIDEIVETKGRDLDKPDPVGDPWTYAIPTSLVVLDPDDSIVPPPDGSLVAK